MHLSINRGPATNLRLFTDAAEGGKESNEERGLEGLMMSDGDVIEYSFTYGGEGRGGGGGDEGQGQGLQHRGVQPDGGRQVSAAEKEQSNRSQS